MINRLFPRSWMLVMLVAIAFGQVTHAAPARKTGTKQTRGAAGVVGAVLPESDPAPTTRAELLSALRGKHPRLLFTEEDLPAMQQKITTGLGQEFFAQLEGYLPVCRPFAEAKFLSDATEGQCQGLWRLPTVALHYVLTGDQRSLERTIGFMKKLLELPNWEIGPETDAGMSAANIMVGAALAYDWTFQALDPAFREAFRKKLLLQARKMYYLGHLNGNHSVGYWQQDPQNNHRWHRDAGFLLCALAVADDPGADFVVSKALEEMNFLTSWLPDCGTHHESPSYMIFGMSHLTLACDAADHCLGTRFLELPFFKNNVHFRMQTVAPGFRDVFGYGDFKGFGDYNSYLFRCASVNHDQDGEVAVERLYRARK